MADAAWAPDRAAEIPVDVSRPRHSAIVRITHWISAACVIALLVSGIELVISHPRFYWGETGNVNTPALFQLPIPASRFQVQTGYNYVVADQNGWSRYLHFQSAWLIVFAGLAYAAYGLFGHFRANLLPVRRDLSWRALSGVMANHLRFKPPAAGDFWSYNALQRLSYSGVVFVLLPLAIWTGLAMSPAIVAAAPAIVTILGGQQSARTIHFFVSVLLALFILVHIAMVCISGFGSRMRAMITGRAGKERP